MLISFLLHLLWQMREGFTTADGRPACGSLFGFYVRGLPAIPFHCPGGCAKHSVQVVDFRGWQSYTVLTSKLRVRLEPRRNKSSDGPHGLFGLFVCLRAVHAGGFALSAAVCTCNVVVQYIRFRALTHLCRKIRGSNCGYSYTPRSLPDSNGGRA